MKKLQLKMMELGATELLTRAQLKKILGGGTCAATFINANVTGSASYQNASSVVGTGSITTIYGIDSSTASGVAAAGGSGAHWCCDSCSSASWYDPAIGSGSF